jgi:hypothetical protein
VHSHVFLEEGAAPATGMINIQRLLIKNIANAKNFVRRGEMGEEDGRFAVVDADLEQVAADVHPLLHRTSCRKQMRIDREKPPFNMLCCVEEIGDVHWNVSNPRLTPASRLVGLRP